MRHYVCRVCGVSVELAEGAKTRWYCPPCLKANQKRQARTQGEQRRKMREAATGSRHLKDTAKTLVQIVDPLAIVSRKGAAAMLGVSDEQIRLDELSIIRKIRAECGELAAEAGFACATGLAKVKYARQQEAARKK